MSTTQRLIFTLILITGSITCVLAETVWPGSLDGDCYNGSNWSGRKPDSIQSLKLAAAVYNDDCQQASPSISIRSMLSGPGPAVFCDDTLLDAKTVFSALGEYELRLEIRESGTCNGPPPLVSDTVINTGRKNYRLTRNRRFIVRRLNNGKPIITEAMFVAVGATLLNGDGMTEGENLNGPSIIRVPDWIAPSDRADPNAVYYLYFAHHQGDYIRMAWAQNIEGPWHLYNIGTGVPFDRRGVLSFTGNDNINIGNNIVIYQHLASPDVLVDSVNQRIVMYFHATTKQNSNFKGQKTYVGTSPFGLDFNGRIEPVMLGGAYFRVFEHGGNMYAIGNGGTLFKAPNTSTPWTPLPGFDFGDNLWARGLNNPFQNDLDTAGFTRMKLRHSAVRLVGDTLQVFYTRMEEDRPERIQMSSIDLSVGDYDLWDSSYPPEKILQAKPGWEGGEFPPNSGTNGRAPENVNQLRDPYIFEDNGGTIYMIYAGRGEDAIGLAQLILTHPTEEGSLPQGRLTNSSASLSAILAK